MSSDYSGPFVPPYYKMEIDLTIELYKYQFFQGRCLKPESPPKEVCIFFAFLGAPIIMGDP